MTQPFLNVWQTFQLAHIQCTFDRSKQVQHIRTHPVVAAKLATGKIQIHGWVYHIKSGDITCCDSNSTTFRSFEEQYAEEIESLAE